MANHKLELLAPAGSFTALMAAVANGADAVYLGGGQFNARKSASNFSNEELKTALAYARERGIKVYVTLNTLLKDTELEEALQFAAFIYQNGADAAIIQDLGLTSLLNQYFPSLKLHASTQMTIHNLDGVKACEAMGISRVVLARELSVKQIQAVTIGCQAETEVFIHGALCVSYSGQCLLSSMIGARSGNRGMCAQPCRLAWSYSQDGRQFNKEAYLLSPKDLMGLSAIPMLADAGVSSLKIEGRMKSPEYVALVTGIYRKYVDRLSHFGQADYRIDEEDLEQLQQIFNRGGFTSGYLTGDKDFNKLIYPKHPKNRGVLLGKVLDSRQESVKVQLEKPVHMGDGIEVWDEEKNIPSIIISSILLDGKHTRYAPANAIPWIGDMKTTVQKGSEVWRTFLKPLMEKAKESFERGESRKVPIKAEFYLQKGEKPVLRICDEDGNQAIVSYDKEAEAAREKPLSEERVFEQLQKTGDTPYKLEGFSFHTDGIGTAPISVINALRRDALNELKELRINSNLRTLENIGPYCEKASKAEYPIIAKGLSAFFYKAPRVTEVFSMTLKRIYVPLLDAEELKAIRVSFKGEIFVWTPPILKDKLLENWVLKLEAIQGLIDGVSVGNPGSLYALNNHFPHLKLHADVAMNVFNSSSVAAVKEIGASSATLSVELKLDEVKVFMAENIGMEAIVYGHLPLMTLEYCPGSLQGSCTHRCDACPRKTGYLKDRKGISFGYLRDAETGITRLFNHVPILMDDLAALSESQLSLYRLSFLDEDPDMVDVVISWYAMKLNKTAEPDQRIIEQVRALKESGYTKGHWFRGV